MARVPSKLASDPDSRYHSLLEAEEKVRHTLWEGADWKRLWLEEGQLQATNQELITGERYDAR